jgi:hypothetical protein
MHCLEAEFLALWRSLLAEARAVQSEYMDPVPVASLSALENIAGFESRLLLCRPT